MSGMTLSYRNIKPDEQYADQIWKVEQGYPEWFRSASEVGHKDFDAYLAFWRINCDEIYGLFNNDSLVAVVYLELLSETQLDIHISVIAKVEEPELVRWFESLKRLKAIDGFEVMTGWLMSRNRGLIRIAEKAGFYRTGLVQDFGCHRGRPIRWIQVRA